MDMAGPGLSSIAGFLIVQARLLLTGHIFLLFL